MGRAGFYGTVVQRGGEGLQNGGGPAGRKKGLRPSLVRCPYWVIRESICWDGPIHTWCRCYCSVTQCRVVSLIVVINLQEFTVAVVISSLNAWFCDIVLWYGI